MNSDESDDPIHVRHKPPTALERPRELVLACPPFRSAVNLSRIVRAVGGCGIGRIIVEGPIRLDKKIARDGAEQVELESRRSLDPVLARMKQEGYRLVGLEQASRSVSTFDYRFDRRTCLVIGHERDGIPDERLRLMDDVIEIPVYGMPFSHNVATATTMALYEYCRQLPLG